MQEHVVDGALGGLVPWIGNAIPAIVAVILTLMIVVLLRRRSSATGEASGAARGARLLTALTTKWQLSLLATAAALLSFAAGWRTWDGMQNFTGEPVASLLMTFGVQAVMLIIAWLIGESFASGLRTRRGHATGKSGMWGQLEPVVGGIVGTLCAVGLLVAVANAFGAFDGMASVRGGKSGWLEFADRSLYIGVALLVLAALVFNHRSDVVQPYVQSARLIAKNAMLWVMLFMCMATSAFFSFDSFFNSIFPATERVRAAEIRSQRQIAGVVNDIGVLSSHRQAEESEALFRSAGWMAYEKNLAGLARASQGAEEAIEHYFVERMEAHKSAMAAQQERIATARGGQAGLTSRKAVLTEEASRLKAERPGLAAELAEKKTELDNRAKGVDAKRVEMMAEERGAEGTLKAGQGPVFRQRKGELQQLQDAYKIQEERVRDAQKRLQTTDARIAQIERDIAVIDGDLAKLRGEAETAAQRIAAAEQAKVTDGGDMPKVDPARVRSSFERSLGEFRQEPTVDHLGDLAAQCTQLLNAMTATPATKDKVRDLDCDPKPAAEAAARVFALNAGLSTFARNCSGGARLPTTGGTDALLAFGRKCLQDSGLPTADLNDMAAKISNIDLNRDDKAHRFVVTWNAFQDGNRLAYLSLAIAVALDGLIFMSGLFGANAVRSPLTEVDHHTEMSADQLDAVIDATLGETVDARAVLSALLGALRPIRNVDGFSSEIELDEREPFIDEMRKVLNAGSNISAVMPVDGAPGRYRLHAGLVRYLTLAQRKPWKVKTAAVNRRQLIDAIGVALLPQPQENAEIVLGAMQPISDAHGFAAETRPFDIGNDVQQRLVMNTLGAGATVPGAVHRDHDRFFVSTDFYKTLLLLRAAEIPAFNDDALARRRIAAPGGTLRSRPAAVLAGRAVPQLEDQRQGGSEGEGFETAYPGARSPESKSRQPGGGAAAAPGEDAATAMPVARGPQSAKPHAGSAQPPPPKPQSSRLASEIRADIIINHGLHPWTDQEIETAWRGVSDPTLERAVLELVDRERNLGPRVGHELDDLRERIDLAYDELKEAHASEPNYVQVLESEVQKIKRLMPVLIMTPAGPYSQIVDEMRRELRQRGGILEDQVGSGRLSPDEVALLERLDEHLYRLHGLSDRALDRNERVALLLEEFIHQSSVEAWSGRRASEGPLT